MRRGIRASFVAAVLLAIVAGGTASATHGGIHPTFRLEDDFLQCLAGNRVQNVPRQQGQVPTWGAAAPTQDLAEGGGCVQYENLLSSTAATNPQDLAFTGTFTGNLQTITIDLYYANTPQATVPEYFANSKLFVDGSEVHTGTQLTFPPQPAGVAFERITYSYTKLEKLYANEDGDGTTEREITFTLSSFNEQQMFFLWGATDAPSKITFNPPTAAPMKLPVA
jgi:hypothetical protein